MKKITVVFVVLVLFFSLSFSQTAEEAMDRGIMEKPTVLLGESKYAINEVDQNAFSSLHSPSEAPGDSLGYIDVEAVAGTNLCLGVEYAFGYLWVTNAGASSTGAPNFLSQIDITDINNPILVANHDQGTPAGWGWRDLCSDGTFLYASVSSLVEQIDPSTGLATGVTIPGPITPNRALAYDPATDAFWTISFSGDLYLFDRSGTVLAQFPNPLSTYGAGWDMYSPGGPYLWLNGGIGNSEIHQVDPATGALTGLNYMVSVGGAPGGLDIDVDIFPGLIAAVALSQEAPDAVYIYEIGPYGDPNDPLPPTNFTAFSDASTPTEMLLTWTDPTTYVNGNPLTNFTIEIERDGSFLASVAMGTETYTDMGLTQYTEYTYEAYAKDVATDSTSSMVSATWMAGGYQPIMVVDPTSISDTLLGGGTSTHVLTITNNQGNPGPLDYTISEDPAVSWLSVSPATGTVAPASFVEIDVDINSSGLTAGLYTTELIVAGNDPFNGEDTVAVSLQVNEAPIVGFSPDSMHFTLDPTGVAFPVVDSLTMTISNTGQGPLDWATGAPAAELMDYRFDEVGGTQTQNFSPPTSPVPQSAPVLGVLSMGGTGQDGAALLGAGGSGAADYVDTGWPTNLTGDWSISFWINGFQPSDFQYIWGDNTAGSFRCFNAGAAGVGNLIVRGPFTDAVVTGATATQPSAVDVIYDSSVPEIRAYVNGVLVNTVAQAPVSIIGTAPFKIGAYSTTTGMLPGTMMDNFKLYDRAIDITEATDDSRQGWLTTNPQSGTVAPGGSQDVWVIADATGLIGGEYDGGVHIISNDPVHPDTTMPVVLTVFGTPQISVDPTTLTFDTILVGASATLPVTVSNTGSFPLNVTNITTTNADFTADTTTFTVDVAGSQIVNVTFNPLTAQTYLESMSIFSDDPVTPIFLVALEGTANEAPMVAVAPDSFHFDLLSGESDSAQFTISNLGNGPLDFTLTDEDLSENLKTGIVDRSYLKPEFNVKIPKGTPDWRVGNPQTEGAGGPDLFGYKWIDSDEPGGPVFNWIDISSTGTPVVGLGDDAFVGPFPLGFTFSYYGTDYTEFYICSNGFLGFGPNTTGYTSLSNAQIPTTGTPNNILPWMWDDLNPSTGGFIYYETVGNQLIVQFVDYPEYGGTGTVTAEVMINSNGSILYQYLEFLNGIDIAGSTAGIENVDGTDGLEVIFNDPTYLHDDLAIKYSAESAWLSENPTSGTIPAGGSMDIWAIASATGLLGGDYLATVIINSNDPLNPEVRLPRVSMNVTGVPRISVSPDPLVFDTVFVGETPELQLTVENIGTDQLDVTSISSSDPVFTLDTTSLSIAPFSSYPVTVTFTPILPGNYTAEIVFETNDPVTPNDTVTVEAVAIEAPVALINAQFSNPVQVNPDDSTDVFINISNSGGSDLNWSASVASAPATLAPVPRPLFGPSEIPVAAELSPEIVAKSGGIYLEAIWDIQFSYDVTAVTLAAGNAGAEFDGSYYYSTRWQSNLLHKVDMSGNLVEEFSIPGVTGLRDLAFDGTFMYGGAAANTIYMMDFNSKTLIGTISSPEGVRHIAYDSDNDAFWVGNWNTDLFLVDRNGSTLSTIPSATHGTTSNYGTAYDSWSAGGPYLWIFSQGGGQGFPQFIYQIDLATGTQTGVSHEVKADFPVAGTNAIAGGLWTSEGIVSGKVSLGGILQGTPDIAFAYELTEAGAAWLQLIGTTSGTIAPMDQFDLRARVYGIGDPPDSAYVVIQSNDPALPLTNILVVRDMITGIGDLETLPTTYDIAQNYPNPFNPTTTIKYQLPQVTDVKLVIYNVLGQRVRTLVNNRMEAGYHSVVWDGLNQQGSMVASGIYIYHFEAGDFQKTMKLMLLK